MNFLRVKRLHFVGIGGIGMSGLAELLKSVGLEVTGSDLSEGETGPPPPDARHPRLPRATAPRTCRAPTSSSTRAPSTTTNPEVAAARAAGIPVIKRAEMLAEVMRVKRGIAIAGTHGKTTTTSMTGAILMAAGLDPTIIVGGRMREVGTARLGRGEYLVAEADEFDRSFLALSPMLAVVNNIDLEHLDTYRDLQDLQETFARFARSVPFFGAAILGLDDPNVQEIRPLVSRRVVTFGLTPQADVTVRDLALERDGLALRRVRGPRVHGAGLAPGARPPQRQERPRGRSRSRASSRSRSRRPRARSRSSAASSGASRRRASGGGVVVIDDYAHHPTEVAATLAAARQSYPGPAHRRPLPAAPLLADEGHGGPVRRGLPERGRPPRDAGLRLARGPARGRHGRARRGRRDGPRPPGRSLHRGPRARSRRCWKKNSREGDLLLTMGAGDVLTSEKDFFE